MASLLQTASLQDPVQVLGSFILFSGWQRYEKNSLITHTLLGCEGTNSTCYWSYCWGETGWRKANGHNKGIRFQECWGFPYLRMLLALDVLTIALRFVPGPLRRGFEFGASGQPKYTERSIHTGEHSFGLCKIFHCTSSQPRIVVLILNLFT